MQQPLPDAPAQQPSVLPPSAAAVILLNVVGGDGGGCGVVRGGRGGRLCARVLQEDVEQSVCKVGRGGGRGRGDGEQVKLRNGVSVRSYVVR
jgi:hypothetical protein